MSSDLYREQLLDHYHNPENFGVLDNADVDIEMDNPTCGDMIHLTARLDSAGRVSKVMFEGQGRDRIPRRRCSEHVKGKRSPKSLG